MGTIQLPRLCLCFAVVVGCNRSAPGGQRPQDPVAPPRAPAAVAPAEPPSPPPPVTRVRHSTQRIEAARDHAQRRVLAPGSELLPELPPLGAAEAGALPGHAVRLQEPPGGRSLSHFYAALDRLPPVGDAPSPAEGPDHSAPGGAGKVRVAVYGASGTAADMWTAYLRAYLQARFGDAGPGVVAAAPTNRWYRHNELQVSSEGRWRAANPQRGSLPDDDRYGLMLQVVRGFAAPSGATTSNIAAAAAREGDLRIARYEVWSHARPGGGGFSVEIDGQPRAEVRTAAAAHATSYQAFDLEPGPHRLSLRLHGDGEVRFFAVVAESDRAGVVVDTLGFDGARVVAHSDNHEGTWAEHMRRRDYDLYVLAYGTNEGFHEPEEPIDVAGFEAEMQGMLGRLARAAPDASCVVGLPSLHADVPAGKPSPTHRIAAIRPVMTRLSHDRGCAVFDSQELIGEGGVRRWVEARLVRRDYVHLTPRGNVRFGMAMADALMRGWDAPDGPPP